MEPILCQRTYPAPPVCRREILRYAGMGSADPAVDALLEECLRELAGVLTYRVCFKEFPVREEGELLDLGFARTASADLKKNLRGCERVVLFAATVGVGADRAIARAARLSPAKGLLMQAAGSERVEALCDVFNEEIARTAAEKGFSAAPRFSPGYGDLPLTLQKEIVSSLELSRVLGITLGETLLMTPSKSVTALIGIRAAKQE